MIKLKSLIIESDNNWNQWVRSMVLTVIDTLSEEGNSSTDAGYAYDIIKTNFRADAPTRDMFDKACKESITILKTKGIVK